MGNCISGDRTRATGAEPFPTPPPLGGPAEGTSQPVVRAGLPEGAQSALQARKRDPGAEHGDGQSTLQGAQAGPSRPPRSAVLPDRPALKTEPYTPRGKGRGVADHNGSVKVGDGLAMCRHFASAYSMQALAGPDGTRDFLRAFKDPESIRAFFQGQGGLKSIQRAYETMAFAAPNKAKHQVDADRLGAYLTEVANHLDAGGGASDPACVLLLTEDHAMAVKVERKTKPDKGTYFAVSVYDPNVSGNHVRVEAASAQALGNLKFGDMVKLADNYTGQLKNPKLVAVAQDFVIDKPVEAFSAGVDAHGLYQALSMGMPDNIDALGRALVRDRGGYDAESLYQVLRGESQAGVPALCAAMGLLDTGAIKAYGRLLTLAKDSLGLPSRDVAALLGVSFKGCPALGSAIHFGRPDAVAAYAEALGRSGLAADDVVSLLASGLDGSRGLVKSLKRNGPETVRAVGDAVRQLNLPAEAAADIYASKDAKGTPILHHMLKRNQLGSMDDLRQVFLALDPPADTLAILLAGKDAMGVPALHSAMREGHADAVLAFGSVLMDFADKLDAGQMVDLLAAPDSIGLRAPRDAATPAQLTP